MRKLLRVGQIKINRWHINLILMWELFEFCFIVWCSLQLLAGVNFLVVDHWNHDDVHATVDGAEDLFFLFVVGFVDVMWPLIKVNRFKLSNIMIKTWQNNILDNLVSQTCLSNIFDSNRPRNIFTLEGFSKLFVGHCVFLCFAKAVNLL